MTQKSFDSNFLDHKSDESLILVDWYLFGSSIFEVKVAWNYRFSSIFNQNFRKIRSSKFFFACAQAGCSERTSVPEVPSRQPPWGFIPRPSLMIIGAVFHRDFGCRRRPWWVKTNYKKLRDNRDQRWPRYMAVSAMRLQSHLKPMWRIIFELIYWKGTLYTNF